MRSRSGRVQRGVAVRAGRSAPRGGAASRSVPALLIALAGGIAVMGSVTTWMRIRGGIVFEHNVSVEAAKGTDIPFGVAVVAAAIALLAAAVSWVIWRRGRRGSAVLVLVAGVAILGCTVYTLATLNARFVDFAVGSVSSVALPARSVRQVVSAILSNATTDVHAGMGLILALGAGGLALLTGFISLAVSRSSVPSMAIDPGRRVDRPSVRPEQVPPQEPMIIPPGGVSTSTPTGVLLGSPRGGEALPGAKREGAMATTEEPRASGWANDGLTAPAFDTVRRGFDPNQVLGYLKRVDDRVEELEAQLQQAELDRAEAQRERDLARSMAAADPYEHASERVRSLMRTLDQEVARLLAEARGEAERLPAEARATAEQTTAQAGAEAARIRAEAEAILRRARDEERRIRADLAALHAAMVKDLKAIQDHMVSSANELDRNMKSMLRNDQERRVVLEKTDPDLVAGRSGSEEHA